ncbi:MAG: phosphodiester glycosidase family protein [Actinomycetota bacterium]|nr:phosphodiester glycosidase family protein [Actinomycetota bacterium]
MLTVARQSADAHLMTHLRQTAAPPRPEQDTVRVGLGDGASTSIQVARFDRSSFSAGVVLMRPMRRLLEWCGENEASDALIGGFYVRADELPLGELRIAGRALESRPFDSPWDTARACVHSLDGEVALRSRLELPAEPRGDLLQAGPMLVRNGVSLVEPGCDPEGFSAGAHQFDSDITAGRYPRAALGVSSTQLIAAVCEGRADGEAGLNLAELAAAMTDLGASDAINLDGGGSASLVVGGRLINTPREQCGSEIPGGRMVTTALRFIAR